MENKLFPSHYSLITSKGFTLVELLVVIAMIGILSAVVIGLLDPATQFRKAQDSRRKNDLSQISKVLEQYYQDHGAYPRSSMNPPDSASYQIVNKIDVTETLLAWGNPWPPSYMDILPKDPSSSKTYVYFSAGQSYWLYASLDRTNDPQLCVAGGGACPSLATNSIASTACGGTCNYGISSPNTSP